jgi:CBS domain-containing protein
MTRGDVMTKDPAFCGPTDSAARVAKVMKTENVGSIPICESRHSRKLSGIVTDRDLVLHVVAESRNASSTHVEDVMTREPFTCHPEDDLQNALEAMQSIKCGGSRSSMGAGNYRDHRAGRHSHAKRGTRENSRNS